MASTFASSRRGFTLIELLVVITIIAILIALLLPAVQAIREVSRRLQCSNNLKQLGLGLHSHHQAMGRLPVGNTSVDSGQGDSNGAEAPWFVYLLPFIEQSAVFDRTDFKRGFGFTDPAHPNFRTNTARVPAYECPSNREVTPWLDAFARRSYVANNGYGPQVEGEKSQNTLRPESEKGVFYQDSKTKFANITDGTSNTIFISELITVPGNDLRGANYPEGAYLHFSYTPNDKTPDRTRSGQCISTLMAPCVGSSGGWNSRSIMTTARSNHPDTVNVLMGDGAVNSVTESVELRVWQAGSTPERIGGELPFGGF